MIKLDSKDFKKIVHLIKSKNELSVFSVINGNNPGEIYVNNIDNPTSALIRTSECNLIAGSPYDEVFNSEIPAVLDFWAPLTPDSDEWIEIIPTIHENHFIRKYKRRQYVLSPENFLDFNITLKEGYKLEKVTPSFLRENSLENSEELLNILAENWGDDEYFEKHGTGYLIHNNKVIVSWSLSDCSYKRTIAIGIYTDEGFRNNGFGKITAASNVKECFARGYEKIHWLCVDSNKGSSAIAEKLGFRLASHYYAFTSYPPIENLKDLSEAEWKDWGEYLEKASKTEDRLIWECVFAYIKSNDVEKTINIMTIMKENKIEIDYLRFKTWVTSLQANGLCSNFTKQTWADFIDENLDCSWV